MSIILAKPPPTDMLSKRFSTVIITVDIITSSCFDKRFYLLNLKIEFRSILTEVTVTGINNFHRFVKLAVGKNSPLAFYKISLVNSQVDFGLFNLGLGRCVPYQTGLKTKQCIVFHARLS